MSQEKTASRYEYIGWGASLFTFIMFSSYIDQIRLNLSGVKGSGLLAASAAISSTLWCLYAMTRRPILWPMFFANLIGSIFGTITLLTSF